MNASEIDTSAPLRGEDLTGKIFGRLTVVSYSGVLVMPHRSLKFWLCRCVCGKEKAIKQNSLKSGNTTSCGCFGREQRQKAVSTHGGSRGKNPIYSIWSGMISRCECPSKKAWRNYGGRGIKVCDRWRASFANFSADMLLSWKPGLTIERKDNNGDYTPDNCIWATRLEQNRNTRLTKRFEHNGVSVTLSEWSEKTGIPRSTLYQRVFTCGWSIEKAIATPVRVTIRNHNPPS